jgi:hypothetical protein
MVYNIGELWIHFSGGNSYFEDRSTEFQRKDINKKPEDCDIRIHTEQFDELKRPDGERVFSDQGIDIFRKRPPEKGYFIFISNYVLPGRGHANPSVLDADPEWNDIKLKYVANEGLECSKDDGTLVEWDQYNSFLSMGIAFRNFLITKNGLQIHCSSIGYKDKGLIFSAPSGTGKSTHVRLWKELYKEDVTIINEDRPAIRYINDAPMLCGTPWSGTSDNFANKIVPLTGIVMIEQAPVNSLERLSGSQVIQLLMPRCFLPYFDAVLMGKAMTTLERLVKDVPVYLLKCRPDYEAVELVRQCLI